MDKGNCRECGRGLRPRVGARGLCGTCYSSWYRKTHGYKRRSYCVTCVVCGSAFKATVRDAQYCSTGAGSCLATDRRGARRGEVKRDRATAKLASAAIGERGKTWVAGPCIECRVPFVSNKPTSIACSPSCCRRYQRRRRNRARAAKYGWNDGHRARARRYGVEYETVSTPAVFERDAYRCGICGGRTDPQAKVPDPRAPTLDHIIPMSRGGPHLYSNVQCACSECNWRKADTLEAEQTRFAA